MHFRIINIWIYFIALLFAIPSLQLQTKLSSDELEELRSKCGTSESRRVARSVRQKREDEDDVRFLMGGINVKQDDAPFSVHLRYLKNGRTANCAGTMISDRHVLTAAHCFIQKDCEGRSVLKMLNRGGWKVYYGGGCLPFAKHACSKFQNMARTANVKSIMVPQDYMTGPCLHNDIAIVTVKLRMAAMDHVACVAQPGDKLPNMFALFSRGSDPTKFSKVTSLATVNLTRSDCFPENPMPGVKADQICTTEWEEMNMCSGDSGSGLMFRSGKNGTWNVAGVASAGTDCTVINVAHTYKKANMMHKLKDIQLDGSVFIDIRQHSHFFCDYIGLCFGKSQKGRKKVKAILVN